MLDSPTHGIECSTGVNENIIIGNYVLNPAKHGIGLWGSRNVVMGNYILNPGSGYYGISEAADYDENIIIGNITPSVYKSGANTIVLHNQGYRTRNAGVATIPADSTRVTVNHGLAKAPRIILLTPAGNTRVWYENVTDTSFDIVTDTAPSEDLDIAWYAEV